MNTLTHIRRTAPHGRSWSAFTPILLLMLTLALSGCADAPSDERPSSAELLTSKVTSYSATKAGPCGLTPGASPSIAEQSCLSRAEGYPTPNWNAGLLELRARCGSEPTVVLNTFTYYWAPSAWAKFNSCPGDKAGMEAAILRNFPDPSRRPSTSSFTYSVTAHMQRNGTWDIVGQAVVCESSLASSCSPL